MATALTPKEEKKEMRLWPFERGLGGYFGMMRRFSDEMDRLFENFGFRPRFFERPTEFVWAPDVEVFERDNKFFVRADLPGMTKDDVKVSVLDDMLTLEGERKQETEQKKAGYYRTERCYGSFYRSLPLPAGAKVEDLQATFKNGVLEVTMPLAVAEKKPKTIEVKAA